MALSYLADPSPAELVERVRSKARESQVVLYPDVTVMMESLKKMKKWRAFANADREYKTISYKDLRNALLDCAATFVEPCMQESGWIATLRGKDVEGDLVTIEVYLDSADSEPLQIRSFGLSRELEDF